MAKTGSAVAAEDSESMYVRGAKIGKASWRASSISVISSGVEKK